MSVYFEILQPVRCRPLLFDFWRIVIRFSKIYAINLSEALAWEQRKLGEIAPIRGGYAFKSSEYKVNGIPIIRISNISSDGLVTGNFVYYPEQKDDEIFSLRRDAILIAMSGATTGKVSLLKVPTGCKYYQNQRVGYFQPTENTSYKFISILVRTTSFSKQLTSVLVSGAQPNVSAESLAKFEFVVPISMHEQSLIGTLFWRIDNLITLHQREHL